MRRVARVHVGKDTCEGGTLGSSQRRQLLAPVLATRSSDSCGPEGSRRLVLHTGAVDGAAALTGKERNGRRHSRGKERNEQTRRRQDRVGASLRTRGRRGSGGGSKGLLK
ncbi:hypothetical protein GQ55_7G018200 [Panicum hallii var. hallii]|uniref:Uncharacterized protein n=1 Tax=Panicum hallii var. hallii TaxID=1504633 RepID=A0A2T7CRV8_9POAL|nr:hypothetical protein GQ55_7G018200 [Panicum hallii var. hallii]